MNQYRRGGRVKPVLPLGQLDAMIYEALTNALDISTNQMYDSHLHSYLDFCQAHHIPTTPTPHTLARYAVYMSKFVKPSSIDTYLSGIMYRLRPFFLDVKLARDNDFLKNVLWGIKRQHGSAVIRKQPITFDDLERIATIYHTKTGLDNHLFLALFTAGFFGLLRLGELTDANDPRLINRRKTIRRDSVTIDDNAVSFTLPSSKTDKFFQGNQILLRRNGCNNDPVKAFTTYLHQRDTFFPSTPWLWVTSWGEPPFRRWFLLHFHEHFDKNFGGHSLRSGGATLLAQKGVDFNLIQALGRWSSDAFRIYIRQHPLLVHEAVSQNA